MGMGIRQALGLPEATELPSLSGIKVYRVTKTVEERVGDHVHVLHGYESFGQTIWTHLEIWDAKDMMLTAGRCSELSMRPSNQRGPRGH